MLDAFAYCEKFLRAEDKDRYLTTLFAPADIRPALLSLYAFDVETARVALRVREPLAGEIRLQWWADALAGQNPEQTAGHPVAAAFADTVQRFALPMDQIGTLLDARRSRLYEEPLGGLDVLDVFARKTAGVAFTLAGRILNNANDPQITQVADAASLAAVVDSEAGTHAYAGNVLSAARNSLMRTRALIGSVPDRILPAFLPLALVNARLIRMENNQAPDIAQWRKQWIIWRASKNLKAYL